MDTLHKQNKELTMKQLTKNTFKSTLGMAFISTSLILPMASMADNPFVATDLGNGYQLAGKHADDKPGEGKCGEGKCGEADAAPKSEEGKCGEGKCGEEKPAPKSEEGKRGEGKCGEGKCGGQ
ncbi:MAG: putative low-complexity protein [Porticoccus sp.]